MIELTDTNIETAVVGLFIRAAQAKFPIEVAKNGEVAFSATLLRDFLDRFTVALRTEDEPWDKKDGPKPEGIQRAVFRVERLERVLETAPEKVEPPPYTTVSEGFGACCPRCGSDDWDLAVEKCRKCGYRGDD